MESSAVEKQLEKQLAHETAKRQAVALAAAAASAAAEIAAEIEVGEIPECVIPYWVGQGNEAFGLEPLQC